MIDRLLDRDVQKFIKDHQNDDPFMLSLKAKKIPGFPWREAIEQIQSLQKARNKFPSWVATAGVVWPPPISIEQASSELAASFKASLIQEKNIVDLTGGMGIDTSFLARGAATMHYVEQNEYLTRLARHNFGVLGQGNIHVHAMEAEAFLKEKYPLDAIYLDPSRRLGQEKVYHLADCSPNLYHILPDCFQTAEKVYVKLAPMVDLSLLVRDFAVQHIWVVAIKNEVKEVLCLISPRKAETAISAINLDAHGKKTVFEYQWSEEAAASASYDFPDSYLYEPMAPMLKAGAFKLVSQRFGLKKLHPHAHIYTSGLLQPAFPGRIFKVLDQVKANKKALKSMVPAGTINVMTRNYPVGAAELKRKYGLKDGGTSFLIGTTLCNDKKVLLLCERVQ